MHTIIGVDCATDPRKVGLARGAMTGATLRLVECIVGRSAEHLIGSIAEWASGDAPVLLAMDAPLGWPAPLAKALQAHDAGAAVESSADLLFRRATDREVKRRLGKQSLDVGADRIARTAVSALALLSRLRERLGAPIPLAWSPQFAGLAAIEVYPAATLRAHGLSDRAYKAGSATGTREQLVVELSRRATIEAGHQTMISSADVLDAAICVLAGADFLRGLAHPPPDPKLAQREGWIWVK